MISLLAAYPKTAHWDTTEDDFEFAYITPVSLPGTPVRFMSEIHIGPGRSIISGPELLQKDLAIRRRAVDDNMRFSDVVVGALKMQYVQILRECLKRKRTHDSQLPPVRKRSDGFDKNMLRLWF